MSRGDFETIPGYRDLPDDMKDVEIAATVRYGLRLFLGAAREGRLAGRPEIRYFRERAAQRAEEGLPLHLLLRTHLLAQHVLWQALNEAAHPGDEAALLELADLLIGGQQSLIGAVAETYLDEQAALAAERRESRRALVRAVLSGFPVPSARLEEAGLRYGALVLSLRIDLPPGERSADPTAEPLVTAGRRRTRRVQTVLDRCFGGEVLTLLEAEGGHALVSRDGPGRSIEVPPDLDRRLRRACGAEVSVAVAVAEEPAGIAGAARTAAEVLRIARALGREPGVHRLDDVLLEYHLSRADESSGALAALFDPIRDRPELLDTLRVYLAQQQDRRGTAALLGLHPNTVDNRLARIGELTGTDVTTPRGFAVALTALTLRALRPEES